MSDKNGGTVEVYFPQPPEVAYGSSGKAYCRTEAYFEATKGRGNDAETVHVPIKLIAFGEMAERLGHVQANQNVRIDYELSGNEVKQGQYAGRVFMDFVVRGVSLSWPWGASEPAPKKGAQAKQQDDSDLPFGWLILVPLLGIGASVASMVA